MPSLEPSTKSGRQSIKFVLLLFFVIDRSTLPKKTMSGSISDLRSTGESGSTTRPKKTMSGSISDLRGSSGSKTKTTDDCSTKPPQPLSAIPESSSATRDSDSKSDATRSVAIDELCHVLGSVSTNDTLERLGPMRNNSINSTRPKEYVAKLCFLMDVTGSMEPQRDALFDQIALIVDDCATQFPNVALELAFVGYRDVDVPSDRYAIVNWTSDPAEFGKQVMSIKCFGGKDEAEDVLGGIKSMIDLNWTTARIKVCFHLGDSPHHGRLFDDPNKPCQDFHPELENQPQPYGELIDEMAARKIDYYFGLILNPRGELATRRMAEVFKAQYDGNLQKRNQMKILDMQDFDSALLFEYVRQGLSRSVMSFLAKGR
jgi:hypothetical protein